MTLLSEIPSSVAPLAYRALVDGALGPPRFDEAAAWADVAASGACGSADVLERRAGESQDDRVAAFCCAVAELLDAIGEHPVSLGPMGRGVQRAGGALAAIDSPVSPVATAEQWRRALDPSTSPLRARSEAT